MPLSSRLTRAEFDQLPGWRDDGHADALTAFSRCAARFAERPYRTGSLGIDSGVFAQPLAEASEIAGQGNAAARTFFETRFRPFHVTPDEGHQGLVTGFYEPDVDASPVRAGEFVVPLLATPSDLVPIDDTNRPAGMDPYLAFAKRTGGDPVEYFDRAAIENGAIDDRAEAVGWVRDRVDAFFIHVQGAARLKMTDGSVKRITYAAKSGQRFTGPGGVLAELGAIPRERVTMQSIRDWFRDNPHRVDEILHQNRSYIFFREAPVSDPALGPIAAAKVPLTAGRSIAVDRLLHTFATPIWVDAPELTAFDGRPFRRLMVAQDTGSAIVGAARGDLFAGSGEAAGEIAGVIRHSATFFVLVPSSLAEAALP